LPIIAKLRDAARAAATVALPLPLRERLRAQQRRLRLQSVRYGTVNFGDLDRLAPISPIFGKDRDLLSIERYYIEAFLGEFSSHVQGRCLEMGDPYYIRKFGGDRVQQADVLHYVEGNPIATIVADLTDAPHIADDSFACIIITQTLQMIWDVPAAISTLHRILKPGGAVLMTTHGISRVARREGVDDWGEYWHFTSQSTRRLFEAAFGKGQVEVRTYGNVLAACGNLHGLGAGEIARAKIDYNDPNYEIIIGACAVKAAR
jgi:hypothetical protein